MIYRFQKRRWLYISLCFLSLCLVLLPLFWNLNPAKAYEEVSAKVAVKQTEDANLLEQGRTLYHQGRFTEAANIWQTAAKQYQIQGDTLNQALSYSYLSLVQQQLNQLSNSQQSVDKALELLKSAKSAPDAIIWAQVWNTQAGLQLYTGKGEVALESWQQAQKYYEQAGDKEGSLGSQINQTQALQSMGFYRRSKKQLEAIAQKLQNLPDSEIKVSGLRSLGATLQSMGISQESENILVQGLKTAQKIQANDQISSILQILGKTAVDLENPDAALTYFEQAENAANNPQEKLQASLKRFKLFVDYDVKDYATPLITQLYEQLQASPPNRTSLYSRINFIASLTKLENATQFVSLNDLGQMLAKTVTEARQIEDRLAEAYALKQWGEFYRYTGQFVEAENLTKQSLNIARQLQAEDIIAQAAWELGRLHKQQNKNQQAIANYTEAVNSLKAIRTDLVAVNSDVQFSFRESVEPVYRELVGLLLEGKPAQANLVQARDLIESLQVAELDNFLREACLDKAQQIDQIDTTATVVYPIILQDRLAVIYSKAGQPLSYSVTNKSSEEVEQTLRQLLASLNPVSSLQERDRLSQQVYSWLITPLEAQAIKDTQTLVFVLDGILRNIPMSALYDGQQYLIEKYAVTLSPGLQLMQGTSLKSNNIKAVVAGISEARSGFSPLPGVKSEVKEISEKVNSTSTLLNEKLTEASLATKIKNGSANVVHLATHGQFSSRLDDTFLLTWDGQINIKELSELLRNRQSSQSQNIDLLVLSACDTAAGDNRAVLGLAGLAIKSGARSTIASLWPVKDQATVALMNSFYENLLKPGTTKAQALRQAQVELMKNTDFRQPFFWSAFVLVGNWQ
ncbi:CHAT domain-containing protein [Rivularia sp. UHCC 0363]|uniref:CHAT domain-containing protein n=1 Tax=Rivularia sp. UHCC 0363 TaxID=3110244 RepID=UPI002B1ECF3B|nr:CHAT domain-containing protein [Rivularia sp. UHCC 0363]MEA5596590.1 CHAT domain-containing protein [Rivularia sp. UHCC 0363]